MFLLGRELTALRALDDVTHTSLGGLKLRSRVHITDDSHIVILLPDGLYLISIGHVSHRAVGGHVRKEDSLFRIEDLCAFSHERDTAKHYGVGGHFCGCFTEIVGIAYIRLPAAAFRRPHSSEP